MDKLEYVVRVDCFGIYNCGAAILSNFGVHRVDGAHEYAKPGYLLKHKDEIIKEFLEYLGDPCGAKILPFPAKNWRGVIAHYNGQSTYTKIAFYMFHDNIKGDIPQGPAHPFYDGSSLLSYLYHNQEKYGVTITRSHMADNVYHLPAGSHPGRCYIITPPSIHSFVPGAKLPASVKQYLGDVAYSYQSRIYPDDFKVLKDLAASK